MCGRQSDNHDKHIDARQPKYLNRYINDKIKNISAEESMFKA